MNEPQRHAGGPAPSDADILAGIAEVARAQLGWERPLTAEMRLVEVLRLDSLRMLTLVVEVENRFRVCLDEHVGERIETVADLIEAIRSELADGSSDTD